MMIYKIDIIFSIQIPFLLNAKTLLLGSNMLTVDENKVQFNNAQNFLLQSKHFLQNS